MGYINFEIGGKSRGFNFSQGAKILATEKAGEYPDPEDLKVMSVYIIFWASLRANCTRKKEKPDFTFDDVCNWVDKVPAEQVNDVVNTWHTEMFPTIEQDVQPEQQPVEEKKSEVTEENATGSPGE